MTELAISELDFLRKLQRLLNEGDFTATYKFALLNALADLSVEGKTDDDGSLRLAVNAIAEKFVEYYWPQARPYRAVGEDGFVLQQNTGRQAFVITAVDELQSAHPTLPGARASRAWQDLLRRVARNIRDMPLWKLQTVGSESDEFLYRQSEYVDGTIRLLPGVPDAFRALHGLVLDAVRGGWIRQINRIAANQAVLADADLSSFLFGSERRTLASFAGVLRDHQRGRCLYCHSEVPRQTAEVDHFIAWSRYPIDLGHNFVLAHRGCNAKKRNFLAHPVHAESWYRSNMERADELAQRLEAERLPFDRERSYAVALWAYEQGERTGAHAWIERDRLVRLDASWRDVLGAGRFLRVSEGRPPYGDG